MSSMRCGVSMWPSTMMGCWSKSRSPSGRALALRDGVETPVDPVREVHIRGPGRGEHALVTGRAPRAVAMGSGVFRTQVGLRFDNAARRSATADLAHQNVPQKPTRDLGSRSRVER